MHVEKALYRPKADTDKVAFALLQQPDIIEEEEKTRRYVWEKARNASIQNIQMICLNQYSHWIKPSRRWKKRPTKAKANHTKVWFSLKQIVKKTKSEHI